MKCSATILLLLALHFSLSKSDQELYITSHGGELCTTCATLNTLQVINSSTTLLFLEGTHFATNGISLIGLDNVTLIAYQGASVTIECGPHAKLQFRNMTHLNIEGIVFSKCGVYNDPPAILLSNLTGHFHTIRVTESSSGALQITNSVVHFVNFTVDKNVFNSTSTKTFSALGLVNTQAHFTGTTLIAENEILYDNEVELNCGYGAYRYLDINYATVSSNNSTITISGTLTVRNNTSPSGIMNFESSILTMNGVSIFQLNMVCIYGALSLIKHSNASLHGETNFLNNSASFQYYPGLLPVGGVSMRDSSLHMKGDTIFSGNTGDTATIESYTSNISIHGRLMYSQNYARFSGTMLRVETKMTVVGTAIIRENNLNNAAIRIETSNFTSHGEIYFLGNVGYPPCRGIRSSHFSFNGVTVFRNNPGIALLHDSTMNFDGNSTFRENNDRDFTVGGGIVLVRSKLKLSGSYVFERNRIMDTEGGAVYSDHGEILFEGHGKFIENAARRGGAVYLQNNPQMKLGPGATLNFTGNSATKGGAIFVYSTLSNIHCISTTDEDESSDCFIDIHTNENNHKMTFTDNNSTEGGSILHVKFVEKVDLVKQQIKSTVLNTLAWLNGSGNSIPIIASDSFQLCFCHKNHFCLDSKEKQFTVSRGERISVSVRAITLIPNKNTHIRSYLRSSYHTNDQSLDGDIQHLGKGCTELTYRVHSTATEEHVVICADESCEEALDAKLVLHVTFQDCPLGFSLNQSRCICNQDILQNTTDACNIDTTKITKTNKNFWIGEYTKDSVKDIIFYVNCPLDYCTKPPIEVDPSQSDSQCANSRSGILCGACEGNTSLVLGTSNCKECSNNNYLFLIVPFLILGVLLVTFIFLTQLTVSNGTIHGLIFYASVVNANSTAFRLHDLTGINVFIEWLNLNFGIETCFYQGLNQLHYTAWQFVFPLYLWILVGMVIVICHFSVRTSRFFSTSNPVGVLATVIFLSYTKLLQNIIVIFSAVSPDYPPNSTQNMWKYDGNVAFGGEGHAVLMAVGLTILLLLFLPYTFVLIFAQLLEKSQYISKLLNRLRFIPFIQAYQAPYKAGNRYWVGLCQLLRCVLLVTMAADGGMNIGLLTTSSLSVLLVSIIGASGGIYTKRWINILEISYILNIGLLTAATYYLNLAYQSNERNLGGVVIGYVSVSVAMMTFIVTVIKQCHYRLIKTHLYKKQRDRFIRKKSTGGESERTELVKPNTGEKRESSNMVTSQELRVIDKNILSELREPLLDYIF